MTKFADNTDRIVFKHKKLKSNKTYYELILVEYMIQSFDGKQGTKLVEIKPGVTYGFSEKYYSSKDFSYYQLTHFYGSLIETWCKSWKGLPDIKPKIISKKL